MAQSTKGRAQPAKSHPIPFARSATGTNAPAGVFVQRSQSKTKMPPSLHVEAMAWLRYGKRMNLVATEAGAWNADVLGIDDNKCVEVEIKKSIGDLRADFRDKVRKHNTYSKLTADTKALWSPNYFWFFTYADIGPKALEVLDELGCKYAGLAVLDRETKKTYQAGKNVSILRAAPRLHGNKPHWLLVQKLQMRMGSELTTLRLKLEMLKNVPADQVAAIVQEATVLANSLTEMPDWESTNGV